ncbi:enoyl-CoA hydratase/isomerase family protein [Salinadaptatus halalkaliphilus]|uniref:Enoyl-CoA hydratase/isomerase family protein n=1 Tax=Salinadaptatus halalkaliphilus TaxID=2419781 RepID=A0A4S3TP00_9EURY|nr:enoyl-CoA hydratase/isomerase family protein [Salinadaptatus halalkaliphilus]THE65390.1 enoyl-CoA hydratase/isomerase family protein [Salinadaptatus halalkaliphilus]
MVSYDCLTYAADDGVARIALDRPDALNALNPQLLDELEAAIDRAGEADDVRIVVLRGNGRAFSAGYDIGDAETERSTDDRILEQRTHLEAIFSSRLPVIAAVDGPALAGGCNLAICCDLTFASARSEFGYPDMHFGEPPPKFVLPFVTNSLKDARELLYSGKTIDAETAAAMGLVNRVVPEGELDATVESEVDDIKKTPSTAVAITKAMLNDVQETQGFSRYGRLDEFVGTLTMESSPPERFREIRDEAGLQEALEWMHETDKP